MTLTAPQSPGTRLDRVGELQSRIRGMESRRLDSKAVPTHPALSSILPGGTLREGTVVQAPGSTSLVMTLLAGPSAAGRWVAVSGIPEFGVEAAARLGIALERLVLVPDPGRQWLTVAAALADVIPVVAVRPAARLSPAEAARFQARLRQRGTVLVSDGEWPGADTVLEVGASAWSGLALGHGALAERELTVHTGGRGYGRSSGARLRLPDRTLGASLAPVPVSGEPLGEVRHVDFRRVG
ncbi:hypothetical protein GE115_00870 [Agromyces sp. CFH 90414]|uniref:Recombinase A n=1 Tax=Agromyces agglutinans TaxID=2662258 RepID=A0A6I2F1S7_9MICO|nr:hypothetical protein [Agromyces agglutinans]MRG58432.1 hypothetical protein [Agromyces agglutinans]